jgi:X-Pro dipeptidyl-peptidase
MRRRTPLLWALVVALALGVLAPAAADPPGDVPEDPGSFVSTDPSAEEAAGRIETSTADAEAAAAGERTAARSTVALAEPEEIVLEDGVTQPVFDYAGAIRETIRLPGATASENSGETDIINVDIIRPAASDGDLQVPTIIIPSPYYTAPGRGRAGENKPSPTFTGVLVGEATYDGNLLTAGNPPTGQTGPLVDCGLAGTAADCGGAPPGFVALIERGTFTFNQKAASAQAAGAVGAIIYNNLAGTFTATVTGVSIPVLGTTAAIGDTLRGSLGDVATMASGPRDGIDFFPLYYDNYFVPRGYAVALLDVAGTRGSTGCLDIGGPAEIENSAKLVEWLAGNAGAFDVAGNPVEASWSNGLSGIVGKSWDGTIANGVASLGVEGLATIVPIEGISSWHKYYWHNGARISGTPLNLANQIRNVPAARCTQTNAVLSAGGPNPDPTTDFWRDRDYIPDAGNVEASVFVVHGLNDYNVKPNNYGEWWDALAAHDVPRKIWLSQVAHEKAFDFRRDEWLVTINRWFDHWLHGIDNGIMDEPMADVEYAPNEWASYDTWPGGAPVRLNLGQPDDSDLDPRPGALTLKETASDPATQSFYELRQPIDNVGANGFNPGPNRVIFMTEELSRPVRLSGTSKVSLSVSIAGNNANLGAYIVDYGTTARTNWASGGGIGNLPSVSCFGQGTATDTGCYVDVTRNLRTRNFEVLARGWANAGFLTGAAPFDPADQHRLEWDVMADDYTFLPGHRIGIVLTGVDTGLQVTGTNGTPITVHLDDSWVELPIEDAGAGIGFAVLHAELDRLVADGGIEPGLEGRIRQALEQYELWSERSNGRQAALNMLDRAVRLLEEGAKLAEKAPPKQGDPDGLRALAASIRALRSTL